MVFLQQFPLRPSLLTDPLQPHDSTNTCTNHFCFPTQLHPVPAWCLQNSRSSFAAQAPSLQHQTSCCLFFEPVLSSVWHGVTLQPLYSREAGRALPSGRSWIPRGGIHLVTSTSSISWWSPPPAPSAPLGRN